MNKDTKPVAKSEIVRETPSGTLASEACYIRHDKVKEFTPVLLRMGIPHYITNGTVKQYEVDANGSHEFVREEPMQRAFFTFTSNIPSKRLTTSQFKWLLIDKGYVTNPYNSEILSRIIADNYTITQETQVLIDNLQ